MTLFESELVEFEADADACRVTVACACESWTCEGASVPFSISEPSVRFQITLPRVILNGVFPKFPLETGQLCVSVSKF